MNLSDFEKLTPKEQLDVLDKADAMECSFFMERLKTAIDKQAPQLLIFFMPPVQDIYWNLIKLKNCSHSNVEGFDGFSRCLDCGANNH